MFSLTHLFGYFSYKSNSLFKWSKHNRAILPHLRNWPNLYCNFSDHFKSTCSMTTWRESKPVFLFSFYIWVQPNTIGKEVYSENHHLNILFISVPSEPRMKWWMSGPIEFLGPWNDFSTVPRAVTILIRTTCNNTTHVHCTALSTYCMARNLRQNFCIIFKDKQLTAILKQDKTFLSKSVYHNVSLEYCWL